MLKKRANLVVTALFLIAEAILYYFVITGSGKTFTVSAYSGIVLCFLFALVCSLKHSPMLVAGLLCTVGADFFLVVCSPIEQLWGMVFFLAAQILYAIWLQLQKKCMVLLWVRIALTVGAAAITAWVLQDKVDALAIISVCYYANLIMNIVVAFTQWKINKLFPIALVLFLLCDTIIGLQVMASGYLPIAPDTWLYNFLFHPPFNVSWFFYLPSQVLIALSPYFRRN